MRATGVRDRHGPSDIHLDIGSALAGNKLVTAFVQGTGVGLPATRAMGRQCTETRASCVGLRFWLR